MVMQRATCGYLQIRADHKNRFQPRQRREIRAETVILDSLHQFQRFQTQGIEKDGVYALLIGYDSGSELSDPEGVWYALALAQVSSGNDDATFRRVGFIQGQDRDGKEWFNGCPRRDIKLI